MFFVPESMDGKPYRQTKAGRDENNRRWKISKKPLSDKHLLSCLKRWFCDYKSTGDTCLYFGEVDHWKAYDIIKKRIVEGGKKGG